VLPYIDRGRGTPLVLIPGLQGRWEYTQPTVDALARQFRVITFSLGDERTEPFPFEPDRGFDSYADHVAAVLDTAGVTRAIVCGISFGGLVALRFAVRQPERVSALVLASAPGPGWHLKPRHEAYARHPWLCGPLFLVEAPLRAQPELKASLPRTADRLQFSRQILRTLATAPVSLTRMAWRARLIGTYDSSVDCARISTPALVVTGEAHLDHVVTVEGSSRYADLIPNARRVVLVNTGHQGTLVHPDLFAETVRDFVDAVESGRPIAGQARTSGRVA